MGSNLSDHQLKIDCYMHKKLYINLMIHTNQKPVIDMQRIKRKESNYITKESQQTMKESKRRIREKLQNNHKTIKWQ